MVPPSRIQFVGGRTQGMDTQWQDLHLIIGKCSVRSQTSEGRKATSVTNQTSKPQHEQPITAERLPFRPPSPRRGSGVRRAFTSWIKRRRTAAWRAVRHTIEPRALRTGRSRLEHEDWRNALTPKPNWRAKDPKELELEIISRAQKHRKG